MLRFELGLGDAARTWRWQGHRWVAGGNWVEPFLNPALESLLVSSGRRAFVVARERVAGVSRPAAATPEAAAVDREEYDRRLRSARDWPLEYFIVESGDESFWFFAGTWGTAPVHVTAAGDRIYGSWHLADLRHHLSVDALDERAVSCYLTRQTHYSRRTLFRCVSKLTERSSATFSAVGLEMLYPEAALHTAPRDLREGADVVASYDRILHASLGRWDLVDGGVAAELSGGLDSANVAVTLADVSGAPVTTYGLLVGGDAGRQQERRRSELVRRGRYRDHTVAALDWAPFCPAGRRGRGDPFSPDDEPYTEALEAILAQVTGAGVRVVLTGTGGDEVLSLRSWERTERSEVPGRSDGAGLLTARVLDLVREPDDAAAPTAAVTEPSLLAAACRSPVFLQAGCWPISPLCTPELIRFCEWLPRAWRKGRRLHRARLEQRGFSDGVLLPRLAENFTPVMEHGLRSHARGLVPSLMSNSILADLGYIDRKAVGHRYARYLAGSTGRAPEAIFEILNLELGIRGLLGA